MKSKGDILAEIFDNEPLVAENDTSTWMDRVADKFVKAIAADLPADVDAFLAEVEARTARRFTSEWFTSDQFGHVSGKAPDGQTLWVADFDAGADQEFAVFACADIPTLCAIIRKQAAELAEARANEQAAIREIGSVVASVAKELDLRFCDPHGNEDVSVPVRRMRDRLAKLENERDDLALICEVFCRLDIESKTNIATLEAAATSVVEMHREICAGLPEGGDFIKEKYDARDDAIDALRGRLGLPRFRVGIDESRSSVFAERDALRERLAKLELAIDAALSGLYGLSFTPRVFNERAKGHLDELKRARGA